MNGYRLYKQAWVFSRDPHLERQLNKNEIQKLLNKGGLMVRNTYDFDCDEETSFWYVIKDHFGGMEELSSKMRNQVKRCFKTMYIKKIAAAELLKNGYEVFVAASNNYKLKSVPPSYEEFKLRINNMEENEFWGCFDKTTDQLVAFSMNAVSEESCEYRTMKAIPEYQKLYAYYGLIYEMNRYYLEELGLRYVNDGSRSVTNHSNIQPFLINKFNFKKAYCHLHIEYKKWFGLFIKTLYPFKRFIKIKQLEALMHMEAIQRNDQWL